MKNSLNLINSKILPVFLAFVLLFNLTTDAVAQYKSFTPERNQYIKQYTAVQDNTRVAKVNVTLAKAYTQSQAASGILSYEQVKQDFRATFTPQAERR